MTRLLAILTLAVLGVTLSGCNVVGAAFFVVHGPEKVKKEFDLPKERATVVFVDDLNSVLPRRALRQTLADQVQGELLGKKVLVDVVDARSALNAAVRERPDEPMRIVDVGRAVQAEVVIYVSVDAFTLSEDGQSFAPAAALRVMVTDAVSDKRVWPADPAGRELLVRMPLSPSDIPRSQSALVEAENKLAQYAGSAVAQLFYTIQKARSARAGN
ncbi:MAG: hypothetical protein FJ255_07915 [Phycisphaerae bacterium]|nr:hypothetical protein [Phycisphaerae bacterium]